MNYLIKNECVKCGVIDEAKLSIAGPHIKQSCNHCGFYNRFIPLSEIPDVMDIKMRVWYLVDKDINIILKAKDDLCFVEGVTVKFAKLQYWNLYLHILKLKQNETKSR